MAQDNGKTTPTPSAASPIRTLAAGNAYRSMALGWRWRLLGRDPDGGLSTATQSRTVAVVWSTVSTTHSLHTCDAVPDYQVVVAVAVVARRLTPASVHAHNTTAVQALV